MVKLTKAAISHNPGFTWRFDYPAIAIELNFEDGSVITLFQDTQDDLTVGEWQAAQFEKGEVMDAVNHSSVIIADHIPFVEEHWFPRDDKPLRKAGEGSK